MDRTEFSSVLERAFSAQASAHGQKYIDGGAAAWGLTGASYLGFALAD